MDQNAVAGMVFTLLLALLIGGFILLYPLTRRLGELLELRLAEKKHTPDLSAAELERLAEAVAALGNDVRRLADRQDFMERLLGQRAASQSLAPPPELPTP